MMAVGAGATFCTNCYEDFSGFMLRKGAGGGATGVVTTATGRNGEFTYWPRPLPAQYNRFSLGLCDVIPVTNNRAIPIRQRVGVPPLYVSQPLL